MGSMSKDDEEFIAFVRSSQRDLRRTAYLMCGDWQSAEDAVQAGLVQVYLRWRKLDRDGSIWGYARRSVVTAVLDDARRARHRHERLAADLPETHDVDAYSSVEDRLLLQQALDALPRRQRAVVILRFVDDLDVRETAFVLKCPEGTVTSSCRRALTFLRRFLIERGFVRSPREESV